MNTEQIEKLDQAIQLFWGFKLSECEQILVNFNSKLPVFALLYADIAFIKAVLTETKEDNEEASKRISDCKKLARSLQLSQKPLYLKQEKDEKKTGGTESSFTKAEYLIAKLVYAETMVMKGIIEFKAQNNIKAGMSFRKSWKQFYQAFEMVKQLPNTFPAYQHLISMAYYGVGIFHFLVSVVPPQYVWLVEGIGFKANRMEGLNEIKHSADIGTGIRSTMAKCCFTLLYAFFFEEFEKAEPHVKELLDKYPDGAMINYMAGAIARKQGVIDRSSENYSRALKSSTELKQLQLFIESELGYNEFLNLNWTVAEQHLSKFLKETTSSGFKSFIQYQLAYCYEMMNMREQALEVMSTVESNVRKGYDFDEFSLRKANRYLKNKQLNQFERLYAQAALLNEAHNFDASNKLLLEAIALTTINAEESAVCNYLLGSNNQQLGQNTEAKKYYTDSLKNEKQIQYDHFIIPYSNVGLAEIAVIEERKTDAKAHLKKAKSYNSNTYDFPSILDWRARKCLQQLGEF